MSQNNNQSSYGTSGTVSRALPSAQTEVFGQNKLVIWIATATVNRADRLPMTGSVLTVTDRSFVDL